RANVCPRSSPNRTSVCSKPHKNSLRLPTAQTSRARLDSSLLVPTEMIAAIFFDFNGVIINDEPLQLKAAQEALRPEGVPLDETIYYKALGMDDVTFMRFVFEQAGRAPDEETLRRAVERKLQPQRARSKRTRARRMSRHRRRAARHRVGARRRYAHARRHQHGQRSRPPRHRRRGRHTQSLRLDN